MESASLDFDLDVALVLGKGRRERALPFGRTTAVAPTQRRAASVVAPTSAAARAVLMMRARAGSRSMEAKHAPAISQAVAVRAAGGGAVVMWSASQRTMSPIR